jgi:hypothetical protein
MIKIRLNKAANVEVKTPPTTAFKLTRENLFKTGEMEEKSSEIKFNSIPR